MRKITRAMQMVSAAKMRKSQQAALSSRTYSELAWRLIHNLAPKISVPIPLLNSYPKASKAGFIVISTNTGLVGSFNTNLVSKLKETENSNKELIAELFVMGRKAKDYAVRFQKNLKADFPKHDTWVNIENIYPLARLVSDLYQTGEYKFISVVYNKFVSTLTQKPTVQQLLPFGQNLMAEGAPAAGDARASEYLFEPDPEMVLNSLLPRIIESQIYQALLESDASEHSARMIMMKNATESAGDLISDLTLTYNQLRQGKITTELSEITAGRIALE
jgi:F-type H+-transporting ATPase subunit gamma